MPKAKTCVNINKIIRMEADNLIFLFEVEIDFLFHVSLCHGVCHGDGPSVNFYESLDLIDFLRI